MLRGIFKIWLARRRKIDQSGFRERYSIKLILWFKCLIVGESFVIADGDDRNERWHEHDPTRWWSFEFAVVKSLLAVSKLPGVYCEETQIMNCYLYMIANYANDTYKHKYYVVNAWAIISGLWFHWNLSSSLKFEGKAQLSLKFEWRTQIWVTNSNLSETVWYPPDLSEPSNLSDHPELRESRQITQNWVLHLILRVVIYLFRWMTENLTNEKSTLIQVMAWCSKATSHYLNQWWPRLISPYRTTWPQWVSILNKMASYALYCKHSNGAESINLHHGR